MYMDDFKLFAKKKKKMETLIQTIRIYSQDIGMEFGLWHQRYQDSNVIIIIIIIIISLLEFFTLVLADGFSLEFEWQQVSSSPQDSSQYSGRSQQCCYLDSLNPSANFQVFQAF